MYSLPSTSRRCAPAARLTKNGWPPTARNARTGELTPPGIYFNASVKSFSDSARTKLSLQKSFRQRAFFRADDRPRADIVPRKPAVAGFQNELDVARRRENG